MNHPAVAAAFRHWSERIRHWSRWSIRQVQVPEAVLHRTAATRANADRRQSANGCCRLLQTRDGWIALTLARDEDHALVPALIGHTLQGALWSDLAAHAAASTTQNLLEQAHLLGLAATRVGETGPPGSEDGMPDAGDGSACRWTHAPRVLDLSALWAGPLASALLARAGCEVLRIDGRRPPDAFGQVERPGIGRLDDGKRILHLALDQPAGREQLHAWVAQADVVITSMRKRAVDALGLRDAIVDASGRRILWLAITAHGLSGPGSDRVGLGDDCAAAGGLVDWNPQGHPQFVGDAIADPLTGLRAASCVLRGLARGETGLLDIALAPTAADAVQRATPAHQEPAC